MLQSARTVSSIAHIEFRGHETYCMAHVLPDQHSVGHQTWLHVSHLDMARWPATTWTLSSPAIKRQTELRTERLIQGHDQSVKVTSINDTEPPNNAPASDFGTRSPAKYTMEHISAIERGSKNLFRNTQCVTKSSGNDKLERVSISDIFVFQVVQSLHPYRHLSCLSC